MKKVIVSAIGGPTGSGIVKCLRDLADVYVIGLDADVNCPLQDQVDEFLVCPRLEDNYNTFVNNLIAATGATLYYPTLQPELDAISEINCAVAAPSAEVIHCTLDKIKLYSIFLDSDLQFLIPAYVKLEKLADLAAFYAEYRQSGKPICIKERNGHGGIGFKILVEKDRLLKLILSGRDSKFYDFETLYAALSLADVSHLQHYFVTEYLEGEEISVDLFAVDGEVKAIVTRKRIRVSNGIVLDGKVEIDPEIIDYTTRMAKILRLTGFSNVQFKFDSEGKPKLIDFNPRFCGSQLISFGAGVNFPYLSFCYHHRLPLPDYSPTDNLISKRYWEMKFFVNEPNEI